MTKRKGWGGGGGGGEKEKERERERGQLGVLARNGILYDTN